MKKKVVWILIIVMVIAIPVCYIYVLNNGNPYTKYIANKYVPMYLEEKGYTENDIKETRYVEPKHKINKDFYHGHYMVVFNDEPETEYYYGISKKDKQVKQFCEKQKLIKGVTTIIETKTKHSEKQCVNSLDNR